MNTPNVDLMRQARESLSGSWGLAVGTFFIYTVIVSILSLIPAIGWVLTMLIAGPMGLGVAIFSLSIARKQESKFDQIFEGFNHIGNAIGAYLLMVIFIFLWSLFLIIPGIIAAIVIAITPESPSDFFLGMLPFIPLFIPLIIPGIIAALAYSMTFFILADDPTMDGMTAIKKSKEMMYGYKVKYFGMMLLFFLWSLLCVLTLGIGYLWLMPYMYVSMGKFYEDIKDNPIPKEIPVTTVTAS